jgi:hypothetical protein
MKVLAMNGRRFDNVRISEAIAATEGGKAKLDLVVENGDFIATHRIEYAGGAKHPTCNATNRSPTSSAQSLSHVRENDSGMLPAHGLPNPELAGKPSCWRRARRSAK